MKGILYKTIQYIIIGACVLGILVIVTGCIV
jgi:hypothetical protein